MKYIWIIILIVFSNISKGQVVLDNVVAPNIGIGQDFYTVQISENETKYYFADTVTNTFNLYNMDFSPYQLNISVPEPFSNEFQVIYVTKTLFDCDSTNIEYVYQSALNTSRPFYVMRTDGTQIFKLDSANGPYCFGACLGYSDVIRPIRNTSDGAKLFLQRPFSAYNGKIFIYSLCGTLPLSAMDLMLQPQNFISVFPNPASKNLNFKINVPNNLGSYELLISDEIGRTIKQIKINSPNNEYVVDMNNHQNGTYFYRLRDEFKTYQSGKILLIK